MPNRYENTDGRRAGKPFRQEASNEDVAEPTQRFKQLHGKLQLIHTLLAGTEAMIEAGRKYLPQHDYESDDHYRARLHGTVLDNFVETTLATWTGKAFAEPPQPSVKDAPSDELLAMMEDVDGAGTAFVPFAKEWFAAALRDREAYAMVDFTADAADPSDPRAGTRAADADSRVVWRTVEACDMLEYREEQLGARTVCSLVRFRDDRMVPTLPWGERLEQRVKVVRPGEWQVYTKVEQRGGKTVWRLSDSGPYDADEVRVVRFCVGERPPLGTLAHMNRRHWESSADQNNVLRVTRFPLLAASGVRAGQTDDITIGPNKFLSTPGENSKIYYVEHTGAAIEQGYKDLERLEDRMASHGAEFMKRDAQGPGSATEAVLDSGEAVSPLRSWVLTFKDCLERALQLSGQWMRLGDDDAGSIDFDMDDGTDPAESTHLEALKAARASRDISRKTYLGGLKKRGVLEEDFDPDDDQAELDDEPPPAGGGLGGMAAGLNGAPPRAPGAKREAPPPEE